MFRSLEMQLSEQLSRVAQRGRQWRRRFVLAAGWFAIAAVVFAGLQLARPLGPTFAIYGGLAAAACAALAFFTGRQGWSERDAVRRVEARFPELNAALLTALEQTPDVTTGRLTVLQHQVIVEALSHSVSHDWKAVIPSRRMTMATLGTALSAGLLAGVLWTAWHAGDRPKSLAVLAPGLIPPSEADLPVTVDPGDIELERGSSLLVLAKFTGPLPNKVQLVTAAEGRPETQLICEKSLDDPVFGARIASVTADLSYRVEFDGQTTRDYRVTVYDLPALERSDLLVQFPTYTDRVEQKLENAFAATVIEGSRVTIACRVNKPLVSAVLIDRQDNRHELTQDAGDPLRWTITLSPKSSVALRLHLTDERDRKNRDPEEFRIDVVPNHPPKIELTFPGKDVRLSPIEEFVMEGRVADDIALLELGVVYEVAGRDPVTVPLWQRTGDTPQTPLKWMLALEDLQVEPDDLLSYHVYAVDFGPDGHPRRTTSDIYFAEVRPFEETFRQADSPPGGGGQQSGGQQQQGNQFNKLIDTQKQIVSAIFNLTRKPEAWSDQRTDSVNVIRESQRTLKEKLLGMIPEMQSLAQQRLAGSATERMEATVERLTEAADQKNSTPLSAALTSAQAAYQALLKLRAREHRVMRGQQQGGGASGGTSPNEQQLQELELTNQKNRYESRQMASSEAQTAQREDLGILDRLRELARRQADLAEKLRELEAARRAAGTDEQKDEIERQLKRLRDEQQQLLQDSDELRNRIAQSNRQDQLANTRQQLEQTRQRQLDATEKLREGQLSQALSSATRAERELQEMHNEFRQQTSARFADAMRDLREEARQLTQRQNELREQLKQSTQEESKPSLRKSRDRTALENEFREQRQALGEVIEQSKEIVKDAEIAEPLLAQNLYEAIRSARDTKVEAAMDAVPSLIRQGFIPAAEKAEEQVQQGLEKLQQGIEKAAEAVLGNEVESLKRARSTLAELSQQLQEEFERQGLAANPAGRAPNDGNQQSQNAQGQPPGEGQGQQPGDSENQRNQPGQQGQPGAQEQRGQPGQNPQGQGQNPQGQGEPQNQPSQGQPGQGQGRGQQPGQQGQPQPGQQGQQGQPGQGEQGQGQQPGPGQGRGQGGQPGSAQGGQGGEGEGGDNPTGTDTPGRPGRPGTLRAGGPRQGNQRGGNEWGGFNQTGGGGNAGPLTGEGYREWAERLRDVESMVSDQQLQAEVARLRDQARSLRAEFKRHSKTPNWELVKGDLYEPMLELQQKIAEEVARRESPDALVPIDRDPVPARYRELVRSYYERLAKEGAKE